jgi:NAD-dependent deacetylase
MERLLADLLDAGAARSGPIVFLTGAGISAESGVPTFRGEEGYWLVGSRNYQPEEMATAAAFEEMPEEVWRWYLHRRAACRRARPNAAHLALAGLEAALGDRFLLVTQNVDGLHLRAGNSLARTYQIHGNIDFCRCWAGCSPAIRPLPEVVADEKKEPPAALDPQRLHCSCGAWLRPHVLWFDESYDEPLFRFESSQRAAHAASLLVVVGTSGTTALPARMCRIAAARHVPLLVIDPAPTPFAALATHFLRATACDAVPEICAHLTAAARAPGC